MMFLEKECLHHGVDVYYSSENDNYYCSDCKKGMGNVYYRLGRRVGQLEAAIREHRDQKADDRCVEDDDRLYEALGDGVKCDRRVGSREDMLANCRRFIENRCEGGGWATYVELEEVLQQLVKSAKEYMKYHAEKFYPASGGETLVGLWPAIEVAEQVAGVRKPCPFCVGSSRRVSPTCEDCRGSGYVREKA